MKGNNMKKILLTLGVFVLSTQTNLFAMQYHTNTHNWNNNCESAISAANFENEKAKKVSFEWRDTRKLIKEAKKAGGDKCVELANKAKNQAILAQQQARDQANAGPRF